MFSGVNLTTVFIALLNLLVGGVLVALVKSRPALKKIANDREANLLEERAGEMESMRDRINALEARLQAKDELHDAERSRDRHRINNLSQCLEALLLLLKQGVPVQEAVVAIEKMRTEQLARETAEGSAIKAALLTGFAP
jgi:hypothetical protein